MIHKWPGRKTKNKKNEASNLPPANKRETMAAALEKKSTRNNLHLVIVVTVMVISVPSYAPEETFRCSTKRSFTTACLQFNNFLRMV